MAQEIFFKKVFFLDENIKFAKCYRCGKELSPHSISTKELKKVPIETINNLKDCCLLYLHKIGTDIHLLFICKHCLKGELFKPNE